MKLIKLNLSDLVKPERNIRIHTEKQINEIIRSIEMFGQIRPLVVDENNVILAGNGLYEALVKMGKPCVEVYRYEGLTENQKKKLMISDNKTFSLGVDDLDMLNEFLEEMKDDLDIPGFDEEILNQMVAETEKVTEQISGYGILDEDIIQRIRANGERQEQKIKLATTNPTFNYENMLTSGSLDASAPSQQIQKNYTDIKESRNFVICPKCGEKIWL